jgi:hypothetical protein
MISFISWRSRHRHEDADDGDQRGAGVAGMMILG